MKYCSPSEEDEARHGPFTSSYGVNCVTFVAIPTMEKGNWETAKCLQSKQIELIEMDKLTQNDIEFQNVSKLSFLRLLMRLQPCVKGGADDVGRKSQRRRKISDGGKRKK